MIKYTINKIGDSYSMKINNMILYEVDEHIIRIIKEQKEENQQLKQIEQEHQKINGELREEMKELRSWLEDEKDRLARECSQIYKDSLGKTRLVNEDIFIEVNRIISKLNELEGKNENNT